MIKEKRRVTLEQKDEILRLHKEGYNCKQIDDKLGLGYGNSNYHIAKFKNHAASGNRVFGSHKLTDGQITEAAKAFNAGTATKEELAKRYNVTGTTITTYVNLYNSKTQKNNYETKAPTKSEVEQEKTIETYYKKANAEVDELTKTRIERDYLASILSGKLLGNTAQIN